LEGCRGWDAVGGRSGGGRRGRSGKGEWGCVLGDKKKNCTRYCEKRNSAGKGKPILKRGDNQGDGDRKKTSDTGLHPHGRAGGDNQGRVGNEVVRWGKTPVKKKKKGVGLGFTPLHFNRYPRRRNSDDWGQTGGKWESNKQKNYGKNSEVEAEKKNTGNQGKKKVEHREGWKRRGGEGRKAGTKTTKEMVGD